MTSPEAAELNRIRLDGDLTYQALANEIGIDASALFRFLKHPGRRPYDRTLNKIRRYLDRRRAETPAPRAAGRRKAIA